MTILHRKIKYEQCVVCNKETLVPVKTPVNLRKNFVRGVGELCDRCFLEVYATVDPLTREVHKRLIDE